MRSRFYGFFLKYVIPEIKFFHATGPNWITKDTLRQLMRPGDVILSKSKFHLTNVIIKGKFSHAGLVVKKGKIAEMKANDFDVVDIDSFTKHATRFALLRLKDWDHKYSREMVDRCMSFASAKYDKFFTLGVDALYCSELVYESDFDRRIKADLSDLVGMGQPYISPTGLYEAEGLTIIMEWVDSSW